MEKHSNFNTILHFSGPKRVIYKKAALHNDLHYKNLNNLNKHGQAGYLETSCLQK